MREHQDLGPGPQEASEPGGQAGTVATPPALGLKLQVPSQCTARALPAGRWHHHPTARRTGEKLSTSPSACQCQAQGLLRGGRGSPGGPRGQSCNSPTPTSTSYEMDKNVTRNRPSSLALILTFTLSRRPRLVLTQT